MKSETGSWLGKDAQSEIYRQKMQWFPSSFQVELSVETSSSEVGPRGVGLMSVCVTVTEVGSTVNSCKKWCSKGLDAVDLTWGTCSGRMHGSSCEGGGPHRSGRGQATGTRRQNVMESFCLPRVPKNTLTGSVLLAVHSAGLWSENTHKCIHV